MAHAVRYWHTRGRKLVVHLTRSSKKQIINYEIFVDWLKSIEDDPWEGLNMVTSMVSCMSGFQIATFDGKTRIWRLDSQNEIIEEPHAELPSSLATKAVEELIIFQTI